jgi:hypothetical protein
LAKAQRKVRPCMTVIRVPARMRENLRHEL